MVKPSRDCVSVRVILREGYSQLGEVGNPEHFWCSLKLLDVISYWQCDRKTAPHQTQRGLITTPGGK